MSGLGTTQQPLRVFVAEDETPLGLDLSLVPLVAEMEDIHVVVTARIGRGLSATCVGTGPTWQSWRSEQAERIAWSSVGRRSEPSQVRTS